MHTFIYPFKDTFINNNKYFIDKNFGIDEILEIYALNYGNKLEYTSPVWHTPPQNSSSYGNEGWLAFDDSYFYVYSGSYWRRFAIAEATITSPVSIADFTGKFSNVTDVPRVGLYVSGSSKNISGSFSGSYRFLSKVYADGIWTSGSLSGSVYTNSSFSSLFVDGKNYVNSPLTSSLTGSDINFENLNGTIFGTSATGYSPLCIKSGSFSGSISGSSFKGMLQVSSSQYLNYVNISDFTGMFYGNYTGSFNTPDQVCYLIKPEFSRTLLHFDLTNISSSISKNDISSSHMKFTLNMTACGQRNLPLQYTIYAYPVSQSWNNGDGRYVNGGSNDGVSWKYRNFIDNSPWINDYSNSYQQVDYLLTASNANYAYQNGGGTWYYNVPNSYNNKPHWICSSSAFSPLSGSNLICSQSFIFGQHGDVKIDITRIVRSWLCGCIPNNGLILMTSLELVVPPVGRTNGLLQFFSKETNTIYSPYIDLAWEDYIYNTGSLSPVTGSQENLINLNLLKDAYKAGSVPKIYVFARDRYFLKQFDKAYQQPSMVVPKYLPTSSYFMIKDAESEVVLIDFDRYSRLSCDPMKGNYFQFDTTSLPQERYYKIFIKSEYPDGTVDIVDTEKIFKITR